MKTLRRMVIITLISIIVMVLGLEILLRVIDPLGVWVYTIDVYRHWSIVEPHTSGYRLPTGIYEWASYTVTILEDGTRFVPASSNDSDCTIATLGDSVTFGHSVNDAETFTNLLASQYPARWLNTARQGYAVDNIRRLQLAHAADGYIYLILHNDSTPPMGNAHPTHVPRALGAYLDFFMVKEQPVNPTYFMDTLAQFHLENMLLIGFEGNPLAQAAITQYGGVLIPPYTARVSKGDGHPNALGHRQIADAVMPFVTDFVEGVCHT